jgi:hypothetical protein
MKDPELKYRLLQQLIDEPQDEYGVTTLGAVVGADHARVLKAIAELVRDGFLEAQPATSSGDFALRVRRRPSQMTRLEGGSM